MAHVKTVFRKCGGLHNSFVCCHISETSIFTSFGFRMLSARTDLLVRLDIVLILSRSLRLFICVQMKSKIFSFLLKRLWCLNYLFTGYSVCPLPVFSWYMYLSISRASSVSPHSIRNFGLSGKKNNQQPNNKL